MTKTEIHHLSYDEELAKKQPYNIAYDEIINKTAKFIKDELGYEDSMSISVIFEYMLWNGYFSKNKEYMFAQSGRMNNKSNYGADIMLGRGTCLNNSAILADLINSCGETAYPVMCYVEPEKLKVCNVSYIENIKKSAIKKENASIRLINKICKIPKIKSFIEDIGNHGVVLCKQKEDYFVSDPTNLLFLNLSGYCKANVPNTDITYDLIQFTSRIMYGKYITFEYQKGHDIWNIPKEYIMNCEKIPFLKEEMIIEMYDNLIDYCNKNKLLFDDLYGTYQSDIDVVCKTLKRKISK